MTTSVYFDLDGTLLEYNTSFADLFAETLPVDATEAMAATYSRQVLDGLAAFADRPYQRAFDAVRSQYDLDVDPAALATAYITREAEATRLLPPIRSLVESIAARHRTGILTNGDGRMQRRKIETHGLDGLVDTILVSNKIGVRKPSQELFEEARDRLPADAFLYVGDTYEEDIVPAREAGFSAVYVGEDDRPNAPVAADGTDELAAVLLPLLGDTPGS